MFAARHPPARRIPSLERFAPMVTLIPVDPAKHGAQIGAWLHAPHVSRWWGNPDMQVAQFDETAPGQHAVICQNATPVGYLRWQPVVPEDLMAVGLHDMPTDAIDIDLFIGAQSALGQGIGPQALEILFGHLTASSDASLAGLCSSVENTRAHAAFEKAGCLCMAEFISPVFGRCFVHARPLRLAA